MAQPMGVRTVQKTVARGTRPRAASGPAPEYGPLVALEIRNAYYNATKQICPDFTIQPAATTRALMRDAGMVLRPDAGGATLYYDTRAPERLLRRIQAPVNGADYGAWTRLTFVLALKTAEFVNFSALDLDTDPSVAMFSFANTQAHDRRPGARAGMELADLMPGAEVRNAETRRTVGAQLAWPVAPGTDCVEVRDISGGTVQSKPVAVPVGLTQAQSADSIDCDAARAYLAANPGAETVEMQTVWLDFAALGAGPYTVVEIGAGGVLGETAVAYPGPVPGAFALVTLILADPGLGRGVYPIRPDDTPVVAPIAYRLQFGARASYWRYIVVPPGPHYQLDDPRIADLAPVDPVTFSPFEPVHLPDGRRGIASHGLRPIALAAAPDIRLEFRATVVAPAPADPAELDTTQRLPAPGPTGIAPGAPDDIAPTPAHPDPPTTSTLYVYL